MPDKKDTRRGMKIIYHAGLAVVVGVLVFLFKDIGLGYSYLVVYNILIL